MSTDIEEREFTVVGVPELTALGKRIEMLRLDRRLSKGVLAQRAGTSRQQLWRVMTGKSELTSSLCARLSEVLEIDSRDLRLAAAQYVEHHRLPRSLVERMAPARVSNELLAPAEGSAVARVCQTLEEYVGRPDGLARTLETLPATDDGRRLKRALLDAIEDIAMARSIKLPQAIFDLRRAVVNDDA
jgi:transcriptional regulator with XRE-family HTH domain